MAGGDLTHRGVGKMEGLGKEITVEKRYGESG